MSLILPKKYQIGFFSFLLVAGSVASPVMASCSFHTETPSSLSHFNTLDPNGSMEFFEGDNNILLATTADGSTIMDSFVTFDRKTTLRGTDSINANGVGVSTSRNKSSRCFSVTSGTSGLAEGSTVPIKVTARFRYQVGMDIRNPDHAALSSYSLDGLYYSLSGYDLNNNEIPIFFDKYMMFSASISMRYDQSGTPNLTKYLYVGSLNNESIIDSMERVSFPDGVPQYLITDLDSGVLTTTVHIPVGGSIVIGEAFGSDGFTYTESKPGAEIDISLGGESPMVSFDFTPLVEGVEIDIPVDSDGDRVFDLYDNCIGKRNVDQVDLNNDFVGDACEINSPTITSVVIDQSGNFVTVSGSDFCLYDCNADSKESLVIFDNNHSIIPVSVSPTTIVFKTDKAVSGHFSIRGPGGETVSPESLPINKPPVLEAATVNRPFNNCAYLHGQNLGSDASEISVSSSIKRRLTKTWYSDNMVLVCLNRRLSIEGVIVTVATPNGESTIEVLSGSSADVVINGIYPSVLEKVGSGNIVTFFGENMDSQGTIFTIGDIILDPDEMINNGYHVQRSKFAAELQIPAESPLYSSIASGSRPGQIASHSLNRIKVR